MKSSNSHSYPAEISAFLAFTDKFSTLTRVSSEAQYDFCANKNNKMQKKNNLQFVDSKKNLKFAHLFGGEIVFIHK